MSSSTVDMKKASAIKPRQTMRGHTDWVRGVALLPDGRRIITCSPDGSLRLWDLESGKQISDDWRDVDGGPVFTIALSPNGKTVASGNGDGTVRLWDVETKKFISRWTGHSQSVESVRWSADGEHVVSGARDGTVRVWDVKSSKIILGPIKTGHERVDAVIYSPDTTKIATAGCNENAIKIWDANTGKLLFTIKHKEQVWSLAWTSDDKKLISGSLNGSIEIFDTTTWQQTAMLEGHEGSVYAISLYQNDRLLATTSWGSDPTARLWNLDTNLPVGLPLQHKYDVNGAAISADGKLLVTGCDDNNAYVWDIHDILKDAGLEDLSIHDVPQDGLGQTVAARKSLIDRDATRRPGQHRDVRRQLPQGFFGDARDGVKSSTIPGTHVHPSAPRRRGFTPSLGLRPHALLTQLSSLFRHSQPNTVEATALQQLPRQNVSSRHRPPAVEVATAQDKQTLYVARRPERPGEKGRATQQQQQQGQSLCQAQASTLQTTQQQQDQSQGQAQASTSQTTPAVASTSTAPPQVDGITTSGAAVTQSQPAATSESPTWWARLVFFVCCASINQYR